MTALIHALFSGTFVLWRWFYGVAWLQVLADRIGVGCTLERGDYNRAWNTVMLFDEDNNVSCIHYYWTSAGILIIISYPVLLFHWYGYQYKTNWLLCVYSSRTSTVCIDLGVGASLQQDYQYNFCCSTCGLEINVCMSFQQRHMIM